MRFELVRYILKRALYYLSILFGSFTVFFFVLRAIPGNAVERYVDQLTNQLLYRPEFAEEMINRYKQSFGLDQPVYIQYILWWEKVIFGFNLGPSFINFPKTAEILIMETLPWSIGLLFMSTLISWGAGILLGTIAGKRSGGKVDNVLLSVSLTLARMPFYLVGLVLLIIFGYILAIFPKQGAYSPLISKGLTIEFIGSVLYHSFLPALSIVVVSLCGTLISARALTITIMGEDYLILAEAKGLSERRITVSYILRNALLPQVTGLALRLGNIVGGSVLVESIFAYPGMGRLFSLALSQLDLNLIQGIVLLSISTVLLASLILDIILPLIDPRVRHG